MVKKKSAQNDTGGTSTGPGENLRRRAEERLKKQSPDLSALRPDEVTNLLHELQVHQIELEMQNEELRRTQQELEAPRARYFDLYDLAPVGYLTLSEKGFILEANLTAAQMLGVERIRLAGQPVSRFIHRDDQDIYYLTRKQLFERQTPLTFELRMKGDDGQPFWVQMKTKLSRDDDSALVWRATLSDITERKRMEPYLSLSVEVLEILNESEDFRDSIHRILAAVKHATECDAVGIRLQSGDDFPYLDQQGFPSDFLRTENSLVVRNPDGGICRGPDDRVSLECTCGLVISGKTDPSNPLFTPGGSFWTNDSFPLLDLPASDDPRLHPRNKCIHQRFASVALVPIREKLRIVGLLQLNYRRKGQFSLDAINALEGIASHIGEALLRKQAENALQLSEEKFFKAFKTSPDAISINRFSDGLYLDINDGFTKITGYTRDDVIGRPLVSGDLGIWVRQEDCDRLVASLKATGEAIGLEAPFRCKDGTVVYGRMSARVLEINSETCLLSITSDITERKRAEEEKMRVASFPLLNPNPIVEADLEGTVHFLNPAAHQLFPDLQQRGVDHPWLGNWGSIARAFRRNSATLGEREVIISRHYYLQSMYYVPEAQRIRIYGTDITDRKMLEEGLRTSRDEMEIRVQGRTAELTESKKQLQLLASQLLTAQENERKRIASEVHDVLGSSLSAIKFKVEEALNNSSNGKTASITKSLEAVIPLVQDTIEEARRIQNDLRPPLLDDLGIIATFSWFCRRFETIYSDIRVERKITIQEEEVPDYLKIALFRIAQEAMNNIGKYARADLVHLGLVKVNGTIELAIQDNGEGFDQERLSSLESSKRGLGLSSMKERTEILGGSFSIESAIGKGTVIKASWPI